MFVNRNDKYSIEIFFSRFFLGVQYLAVSSQITGNGLSSSLNYRTFGTSGGMNIPFVIISEGVIFGSHSFNEGMNKRLIALFILTIGFIIKSTAYKEESIISNENGFKGELEFRPTGKANCFALFKVAESVPECNVPT